MKNNIWKHDRKWEISDMLLMCYVESNVIDILGQFQQFTLYANKPANSQNFIVRPMVLPYFRKLFLLTRRDGGRACMYLFFSAWKGHSVGQYKAGTTKSYLMLEGAVNPWYTTEWGKEAWLKTSWFRHCLIVRPTTVMVCNGQVQGWVHTRAVGVP